MPEKILLNLSTNLNKMTIVKLHPMFLELRSKKTAKKALEWGWVPFDHFQFLKGTKTFNFLYNQPTLKLLQLLL